MSGCLIIGNVTFNDLVKVVTTSSLQHKGKFSSLLLASSQWGDSLALCEYLCPPIVFHVIVLLPDCPCLNWLLYRRLHMLSHNTPHSTCISWHSFVKKDFFSSSRNEWIPVPPEKAGWKLTVLITSFQSKELVLLTGLVLILAVCIGALLLPPEEANGCCVCCVLPVLMINS